MTLQLASWLFTMHTAAFSELRKPCSRTSYETGCNMIFLRGRQRNGGMNRRDARKFATAIKE
jgi:hypothetical protein